MIETTEARVLVSRDDLFSNVGLIERRERDEEAELRRLVRFDASSPPRSA